MHVDVLGSLQVRVPDRTVNLGGPRWRSALSWLVMNANQPVSYGALAEAVWRQPPADAPHRLRMLLRSLAIQLSPGTLRVAESAHLVLADGAVDAERFSGLIRDGYRRWAAGECERAGVNIDEALRLWRGTPYPELGECLPAAAEIARLNSLRADAMELQQEAVLRQAVDFTTVADLRYLVAGHPERRAFRLQLARALYMTSRQIEALQVLRQLVGDLGDDPVARQLTTLFLRRDPAAATTSTLTTRFS